MKTERSAGGVIVRNIHGAWMILVMQDMNDSWTFPKGKIDPGETPEHAARREILEEVGIRTLTTIAKLPDTRYTYKKDGLISKTVQYFLFESKGNETLVNQTEEGIHNATWMPIEKASEIIGYQKTNRPLLLKAKQWTLNPHLT